MQQYFNSIRDRSKQPTPVKAPAKPAPAPAPVKPAQPVKGLKRALFVGINYRGTPYELYGCINDAINMQNQIAKFFPNCKETRLLTDNTALKPTRKNILDSIAWLVDGLLPGQNVYFHYSGHGGIVRDANGDEVSGLDSCIYPYNGSIEQIIDDEMRSALAEKIPAGCKCFVVLDSCHSGTAVDLRYVWNPTKDNKGVSFTENTKYPATKGDVIFLSGCTDSQFAMDTVAANDQPCGALSMAFLDVWKRYGPVLQTSTLLQDVRTYLKQNGYEQIPQLSTGGMINMVQGFDLR